MSASHQLLQLPTSSQPDHANANASTFDITIRFSASLPDLPVTVASNVNANTATLKQVIRESLPVDFKARRIRLIFAGKALPDDGLLSTSLKRTLSHPPSRVATPGPYDDVESQKKALKGKGKEVVRDPPTAQPRIYIHCSIGDVVLSPIELADEASLARRATGGKESAIDEKADRAQDDHTATTPVPRGFDRLLSAGFSASEVQSLRLQFMDIQAHVHTPDTMPSPNTLRNMEDRWLDNGNGAGAAGGMGGGVGMADDDVQAGALDDMLWGAAIGFFWPIGCLFWGAREEGIWSQRRRMAVILGVVLNIGVGLIRYTS